MIFLAQTTSDQAAANGIAAFMLVFFAFLAIAGGFWWWAFLSAVTKPSHVWEQANQNKTLWIVLMFGLGVLGSIGYLVSVRSKLIDAEQLGLAPAYMPRPTSPIPPTGPPSSYAPIGR